MKNPMKKTQQDIEYEWFTENYAEISRKHPRRFVVIKDMEVVGDAATGRWSPRMTWRRKCRPIR